MLLSSNLIENVKKTCENTSNFISDGCLCGDLWFPTEEGFVGIVRVNCRKSNICPQGKDWDISSVIDIYDKNPMCEDGVMFDEDLAINNIKKIGTLCDSQSSAISKVVNEFIIRNFSFNGCHDEYGNDINLYGSEYLNRSQAMSKDEFFSVISEAINLNIKYLFIIENKGTSAESLISVCVYTAEEIKKIEAVLKKELYMMSLSDFHVKYRGVAFSNRLKYVESLLDYF